MAWRERSPMDERLQFVADYTRQRWTITALSDRYGISRKTAYKWIARYDQQGTAGLAIRSSRPWQSPQTTAPMIVKAIVALRRREGWGGKKIVSVLAEQHPGWVLPAVSTTNDILKRAGLVARHRRRRPVPPSVYRPVALSAPNEVWTADFKGQFRTRTGQLCYPLTICDGWSRFLLTCHALPSPTTRPRGRSFAAHSASTDCRRAFAPTMANPLPRRPRSGDCPGFRWIGFGSAFILS
jgi:putative transposase